MTLDDFKDGDYDDQSEPEKRHFTGHAPIQVAVNGGASLPEFLDTPVGNVDVGYVRGSMPFQTQIEAMTEEDALGELEEFAEKKKDQLEDEFQNSGTHAEVYVETDYLRLEEVDEDGA